MRTTAIGSLPRERLDAGPRPCNTLPPPAALRRFTPEAGEGPASWVSYTEHPAYAHSVQAATLSIRLRSVLTFSRYFTLILTKRLISYELIPAHVRAAGGLRFVAAGLRHVWQKIGRGASRPPVSHGAPVQQALTRDGICVAAIDSAHFEPIAHAVRPLIDGLRRARGNRTGGGREFAESRAAALRTANADLFIAVDAMLAASGILAGISNYLGRDARLVDVNPQINDASDDFWQRTFPDLPAEPRPASYFHRDASGGDIKAIVYLSDVGAESGPFSYSIGSHRVHQSTLADWIEETNDQAGFSSTDRNARRQFAALPMVLRRKCAFGNDLTVEQPITQRILGSEWVVTAPRGHVAIFDTKGFHRGGMVAQGERVVLTCVIGSARRRSHIAAAA